MSDDQNNGGSPNDGHWGTTAKRLTLTEAARRIRAQAISSLSDHVGTRRSRPSLGHPCYWSKRPTLIFGDSDMFRPEHIVKFYQLLGGGLKDAGWQREHMSQNRLAILPNP